MKSIEKLYRWIWKNKEWLFSGVGITLLAIFFSMLFNKSTTNISDDFNVSDTPNQNNGSNIEIHGNNCGAIYQNSTINNYGSEESDNDSQKIIMSESKYLEYLQSNVDGDIIFHYYDDYDGDGTCEMFALVGEYVDFEGYYDENNMYGKIWFVDENGILEIESEEMEYWSSPYKFLVENKAFVSFEEYYATDSLTYVWGVMNGRPYQPNISGKGNGLTINKYNEIQVIMSSYDFALDKNMNIMLGHTWKPYYFYFDGKTFREYGGISVEIEDLLKLPDVKNAIDSIYSNMYKIDSIYYRDNGIININLSKEKEDEIEYRNITLRYNGKSVCFLENGFGEYTDEGFYLSEGFYMKAVIESMATYPDSFIY